MKRHVIHTFSPIISPACTRLILGSVPSVKSVEQGFYYMNPRNRFWQVLSALFHVDLTAMTKEEKTAELLAHGVGLYDAVFECDIEGSSDSKISNVVPADINALLRIGSIESIFCNGAYAYNLLTAYFPNLKSIAVKMPSTSPANAAATTEKLIERWSRICQTNIEP